MTVYECDFCGKQFHDEGHLSKLSITNRVWTGKSQDICEKSQDICEECCSKLAHLCNDTKENHKEKHINDDQFFYGVDYHVVDLGDGNFTVTRSKSFSKDGRKLTRADIYKGRWEEAASEYAYMFMCGGFPTKPDPKRPSEEEWMAEEPYPHEVDRYITEKLFPRK